MLGRLGDVERASLEVNIRQRIFHRGDLMVEEGQVASFVRILKLGTAFAYRRGLDGQFRPIGALARGNAFGLFGLFDCPSQASGVALTTVRVCEVPVGVLRAANGCGSQLVLQAFRAIVVNFAAVAAWSEAMRLPGAVNQLAYVMLLLADAERSSVLELPSQVALAELLGTRRETIARALRTLDAEGGIRRHDRRRCEVNRSVLLARLTHARHEQPK